MRMMQLQMQVRFWAESHRTTEAELLPRHHPRADLDARRASLDVDIICIVATINETLSRHCRFVTANIITTTCRSSAITTRQWVQLQSQGIPLRQISAADTRGRLNRLNRRDYTGTNCQQRRTLGTSEVYRVEALSEKLRTPAARASTCVSVNYML